MYVLESINKTLLVTYEALNGQAPGYLTTAALYATLELLDWVIFCSWAHQGRGWFLELIRTFAVVASKLWNN